MLIGPFAEMNKLLLWKRSVGRLGLSGKKILAITTLSVLATISEMLGIGIFLPIFQYIQLDGDLNQLSADSEYWNILINLFNYYNTSVSLAGLLLLAFLLLFFRQFFLFVNLMYQVRITNGITKNIRDKIFSLYMHAKMDYIDRHPIGDTANTVTTEVSNSMFALMSPIKALSSLVMVLGYVIVLMSVSIEMTLAAIFILFLTVMLVNPWIQNSRKVGNKVVAANSRLSSFMVDRFSNMRLTRLSGLEGVEKSAFSQYTEEQRLHNKKGYLLQALLDFTVEPVVILSSLIFLYVSYMHLGLKIESIGLYLVVVMRLIPSIKHFLNQWQKSQRYYGSLKILEDKVDNLSDSLEHNKGAVSNTQRPVDSIEFQEVSYVYGKDGFSLANFDFKVKGGEVVLIVGESGSGKSTFVDLIPRLRDVSSGCIKINNTPIQDFSLHFLRALVSYVSQRPQAYKGSVLEHIKSTNQNATMDDVLRVSKASGVRDFIELLPKGYDTLISPGGVGISGGQMIRIDIARALLSNSEIYIFDEVTSNLDAVSENKIHDLILDLKQQGKLVFVISHKASGIDIADRIALIRHGNFLGIKGHTEWMRESDYYRSLLR